MSNQNLKGVGYDTQCYTIIFVCVSSHNGQMFSFVNQLNNRFEFYWDRWGEWTNTLTPYSCHAFLVRSYNTKTDSGMGFVPVSHLCEFLNLKEARVFNAAYLLKYNKAKDISSIDEMNDLAGTFGTALLDMAEMREEWEEVCERSARTAFQGDVLREFFGDNPIPLTSHKPWDADLFDVDFYSSLSEQEVVMEYDL